MTPLPGHLDPARPTAPTSDYASRSTGPRCSTPPTGGRRARPELEAVALDWYDTFYGDNDGIVETARAAWSSPWTSRTSAPAIRTADRRACAPSANVTLYDSVTTWQLARICSRKRHGRPTFSMTGSTSVPLRRPASSSRTTTAAPSATTSRSPRPAAPSTSTRPRSGRRDRAALGPVETGADVRGYHVYRSRRRGRSFRRGRTPTCLDRISYFRDTGLDLLTRYYYRVTAVDTSLVEARRRRRSSQSTAPPEPARLPAALRPETSSPLAVGDVTATGQRRSSWPHEVYVWHHDGHELIDGDDDSQTLGAHRLRRRHLRARRRDPGEPGRRARAGDHRRRPRPGELIHVYRRPTAPAARLAA